MFEHIFIYNIIFLVHFSYVSYLTSNAMKLVIIRSVCSWEMKTSAAICDSFANRSHNYPDKDGLENTNTDMSSTVKVWPHCEFYALTVILRVFRFYFCYNLIFSFLTVSIFFRYVLRQYAYSVGFVRPLPRPRCFFFFFYFSLHWLAYFLIGLFARYESFYERKNLLETE